MANNKIAPSDLDQMVSLVSDEFSEQEKTFIQLYSESLNKTRSYVQAFDWKGDGPGAIQRATTLLKNPKIHAEVSKRIQSGLDLDVSKSPSLLLKYIEAYLQLDVMDYYTDEGNTIPLSELSPEQRMLISNVVKQINNKTGQVEVTYALPDKTKLLDKLSDLVKFVAQVKAFTGDIGDESSEAARKRDEIFNEVSGEVVATAVKVRKKRILTDEEKRKISVTNKRHWAERKAKKEAEILDKPGEPA